MVESGAVSEFVFFYGTLLPDFVPEAMGDVVARLDFYGEGSAPGMLFDLGEYPGAIFGGSSSKRVFGAVFQLPEDSRTLEALDRYEGYEPAAHASSLFVRKRVRVDLATGSTVESWAYEYNGNPQDARVIASGRYEGQR